MKKYTTLLFLFATALLVNICGYSQKLSHVQFSGATTLSALFFTTDQRIVIKLSDEGTILEWGNEYEAYRNYYPGRLQPYMGRVDYYGPESDSVLRGKVKSIGTAFFNYFSQYDTEEKKGKLMSIGSTYLEYYSIYDNQAKKGKIKMIGNVLLDYYSSFENEAIKGKLKMVGNNLITYYTTFDQKYRIGKIKSIGSLNYTWVDNHGIQNTFQIANMSPTINGIIYFIM